MMASRTKGFAIASWAFSSAIETFVIPMADATAEMHFTLRQCRAQTLIPSVDGVEANVGNI
jgi:hypothetical protein